MDFTDLHVIGEMFARLDGKAGLEQRMYDAYQRRLAQQRARYTPRTRRKKTQAEIVAYKREWRRANADRVNAKRREQRKVARLNAKQLADKRASWARWYAAQKQDPAKWRRLLDRQRAA